MSRLHPIVFWLAGVKLAFHLLIIRGYGWFRDEFYYIACGERLDWGYVDHPPLVAVVTAATRFLLGDSLVAIRLPAALAGAATVLVAGLLAHELGARRFGQGLAALAVLVATIYLPLHHILSMNAWEPLLWSCVALFVLRGLDRGRAREWVYAGVLAGIALQNKHSMLFFGFALAVGLVLSPARRALLTRGPWLMGLIAAAIFLPNIIWEVRHGWPTLEFMQHARAHKNVALPAAAFVAQQVLVMNPVNAIVWVTGLCWLLAATSARGWRFLGWGYLTLLALLIATGGKDYYLAPYYPMLFAAGGVAIERWTAVGHWRTARVALPALIEKRLRWLRLSSLWTRTSDMPPRPASSRPRASGTRSVRCHNFLPTCSGGTSWWRKSVASPARSLPPTAPGRSSSRATTARLEPSTFSAAVRVHRSPSAATTTTGCGVPDPPPATCSSTSAAAGTITMSAARWCRAAR